MIDASKIKEQMEVKGSDGKHIGTVDAVEGKRVSIGPGAITFAVMHSVRSRAQSTTKAITPRFAAA
jgi:hypothetical protein